MDFIVLWTTSVTNTLAPQALSFICGLHPVSSYLPSLPIYLQNKQPLLQLQSIGLCEFISFSDMTICLFNFLSLPSVLYFDFLSYELCFPALSFYSSHISFHSLLSNWAAWLLFPKYHVIWGIQIWSVFLFI